MPVKEIAQIGAAIGREFSHELIAAVAPMPPPNSMMPSCGSPRRDWPSARHAA